MAKSIPTTTPPLASTAQAGAATAERSIPAANPGSPPGLDLRLATAEKRVQELERQLKEAADVIAATRQETCGLQVPFQLKDPNHACRVVATNVSFRFAEGRLGSLRRQKLFSLFMGLHEESARLQDGQHIDNQSQGFFWLLDNLHFEKGPHDA